MAPATAALMTTIASPICAVVKFMASADAEDVVKLYVSINSFSIVPLRGVDAMPLPERIGPSGVARSNLVIGSRTDPPMALDAVNAKRAILSVRADSYPGVYVGDAPPMPLTAHCATLQAEAPIPLVTPTAVRHID